MPSRLNQPLFDMPESTDVQLARLDERLKTVLTELMSAREGRKEQYETTEAMRMSLQSLDNRVEQVEKSLASTTPTLNEFVAMKNKVAGAGFAGRYVWMWGGAIIGVLAASRESIFSWFSK